MRGNPCRAPHRRFGPMARLAPTARVFLLVPNFHVPRIRAACLECRPRVGNPKSSRAAITPFCSCSAVPLFIGFVTTGDAAGRHVFVSGFRADGERSGAGAVVRVVRLESGGPVLGTGLLIAMISGWAIGRLHMEPTWKTGYSRRPPVPCVEEEQLDWPTRIRVGVDAVRDIVGRVWFTCCWGSASERPFTATSGGELHAKAVPKRTNQWTSNSSVSGRWEAPSRSIW